nr:polysaccharide deacetylase family protein [Actinomycetales bacterium]
MGLTRVLGAVVVAAAVAVAGCSASLGGSVTSSTAGVTSQPEPAPGADLLPTAEVTSGPEPAPDSGSPLLPAGAGASTGTTSGTGLSDAARACVVVGDDCPGKTAPTGEEVRAAAGPKVFLELVGFWEGSGGAVGAWGDPVAEHVCTEGSAGRGCGQDFENGTIRWREGVGVIDCAALNCVALTFDDGPADDTPRLLEILVDRNVQATFYLLGHRMHGRLAEMMPLYAPAGMEVGNHTWNHPDLRHLSADGVVRELAETSARIEELAGVTPRTLRPPYGARNSAVDTAAGAAGLAVVGWSAGPEDWMPQSMEALIDRTVASSSRGAVILLHDTYPATVDAVPGILDGLQAAGLTPVTVGDLFGPLPPGTFVASKPGE